MNPYRALEIGHGAVWNPPAMTFPTREVVTNPDGQPFLVHALPKGGLKELTPRSGVATWVSVTPFALSVLGFVLHYVVFRGRWVVRASPIVHGDPVGASWTAETRSLAEANQVADELMRHIREGSAPG